MVYLNDDRIIHLLYEVIYVQCSHFIMLCLVTIMYLTKENFTCPKEQISIYFSVIKQFTLS